MAIEIVKFSNVLVYWAITDDLKVFDLIFWIIEIFRY